MAEEFLTRNTVTAQSAHHRALDGVEVVHEPREASFKPRVPRAIGLIRTGDTTQYGNLTLISA